MDQGIASGPLHRHDAILVYPVISALYLAGIGLLFGTIVPVDLRLLRALGPQFDQALPSLVRIALLGFAIAAASGALLACVRIRDCAENPAFLTKVGIVLMAEANTLLLRLLTPSRTVVDATGTAVGGGCRCSVIVALAGRHLRGTVDCVLMKDADAGLPLAPPR